jgi:hypothetical protein
MEKTEIKIQSGLTPKAFIIATIGEILILFMGAGNGIFYGHYFDGVTISAVNTWKYTHLMHWVGVTPLVAFSCVTLLVLITATLNFITKKSVLSKQEMTVIATSLFFGIWWYDLYGNVFMNITGIPGAILGQPAAVLPMLKASLPPILKPDISDDVWKRFMLSPLYAPDRITTPPWGPMLPMMLWLATMMSFWCFIFVFSVVLLRYVWFTVEYLVSPPADIIASLIDYSQPVVETSGSSSRVSVAFFKNKYFIIPFILCFVWSFLSYAFNQFNGLYTWYTTGDPTKAQQTATLNMGGFGPLKLQLWPNFELTQLALLPWVSILINLAPHWIAWGLLLPLSVLGNTFASWVAVDVVWPLIMVAAGLWPTFVPGQGEGTVYGLRRDPPTGDSIYALYWGLLIGLALYPIVVHWRSMAPIFKSIFKKEPKDFDPDQPMAYRWVWIGLIACSLIWIVLIYQLGPIPLHALITWLVMMILIGLGSARMVAETGGLWGWAHDRIYVSTPQFAGVFMETQWFKITGPQAVVNGVPTPEAVATSHLIGSASLRGAIVSDGLSTAPLAAFTIRAGDLTHTSKKSIFMILIWSILISFFVGGFIFWWQQGVFSPPIMPAGYSGSWNAIVGATWRLIWERASSANYGYLNEVKNPGPSYALILGGLLFAILIPIAKAHIPKLAFINVAAITLGVWVGDHLWASFLVALIIKLIAIKVAGFTVYEQKIRPIAMGIFAGVMFGVFFNAIGQTWLSTIAGRMY